MAQMTIQQAFELGVRHHQAGQLREAESIFQQILSAQANHSDALHFLGLIFYQTRRAEMGIDLLRRAIGVNPQSAYCCNLGRMLSESGRLNEALAAFEQAIRLRPDNAEAHLNLGSALLAADRVDRAIESFQTALRFRPNAPDILTNLGQALHEANRRDEAIVHFKNAIELNPRFAPAFTNLGIALQARGDIPAAVEVFREALRLDPAAAIAWINFGKIMQSAENQDAAVDAFREAARLSPQNAAAYYNLGNALHAKRQYDDAIVAFNQALALQPAAADVQNNLGLSLHALGRFDEAIIAYNKALQAKPDDVLSRYNLGIAQLVRGDYESGWAGYEMRTRAKELETDWPQFSQPRWNGEDLAGRRILIHAEQALGDTIQFIRYLPLVQQRGGKVLLQVQPELFQLLKNFPSAEQVLARDEPLLDFDVQCPLLSLPMVLRNDWKIPNEVPYLAADAQKVEQWKSRLGDDARIKIGLVWAGRPQHKNDHNRSMPAQSFSALNQIPDVRFFSLQKGPAAAQLASLSSQLEIVDLGDELVDFVDTAALVSNLDLVITVDTAVAHLAGALGKQVWVLLPFVPDWRWLLHRSDSPWYPTAKLFRQPAIGDWETPMREVAVALEQFRIGGNDPYVA